MTSDAVQIFSNRAYALSYAKQGWPVFPLHEALGNGTCSCGAMCGNPGKHPRTKNGLKSATTDTAVITRWWTETPNAPIGIVCGDAQNLLVVDIDPRNGGADTWAALVAEHGVVQTVRIRTGGGGEHLYFKAPKTPVKSRGNALGPGVDVSSNGHYVVAPPSLHASGARYEFAPFAGPGDMALADCPDWLISLANAPKPREKNKSSVPSDTRGWMAVAFEAAGKLGEWQPAGFWFACCPWLHEHSDGRGAGADSSCIVYPATSGKTLGWWRCEHAHCAGRSLDDVKRALPESARSVAAKMYPPPARAEPRSPAPAPSPQADPQTGEVPSDDWQADLLRTKEGVIVACSLNASRILAHDPAWAGVLAYDEFGERILWAKPPPWAGSTIAGPTSPTLTDEDATRLSLWLHRTWGLRLAADPCWQLLQVAGRAATIHPVRDYLDRVGDAWDGIQRLTTAASVYLGAAPTSYHHAVLMRWLISGVARIYSPGCRADCVLILEGPQGARKSSALAALASDDWFCDDIGDIRNKDSADALRGKWIAEIAELASVRRADVEAVKAFLSRRCDHFRPAYGRCTIDRQRQTIFAGSTNSQEYQTDPTGLRRFWAVACGTIDLNAIARDRDQLWGEAVARYRSHEQWWLTSDEEPLQISEQSARREGDPWTPLVLDWCESAYIITIESVLSEVLDIEPGRRTPADSRRVGAILRLAGYTVTAQIGSRGNRSKRWTLATAP